MDATMRNEEGFTIIELITSIAILGIMTAIAIPNIVGRMPTIRVNSAARDLASGMRLARAKAVSESNRYVITFDTANNQYTIHDDNDSDGNLDETGAEATDGDESSRGPFSLPTGIIFGCVAGEVSTTGSAILNSVTFIGSSETFGPNGTATKNGSIYLIPVQDITSNRKGRQRAITVIRTGRIKIWKYCVGSNPPWK